MSWRQLPNLITAARIALILPLIGLMRNGDYRTALAVAMLAAFSDGLDGFLAKRYGWQTRLGGLLDPIADKLLLAACFVGLWAAHATPAWLMLLVLGRDLLIVCGAVAFQVLVGPVEGRPTWLSKATTALQLAYVLAGLLHLAWATPPASWLDVGVALVALATLASGIDYVLTWSRRALRERHRLPR
jgi:cardiolipin synthase (CMP-forming)